MRGRDPQALSQRAHFKDRMVTMRALAPACSGQTLVVGGKSRF